MLVGLGVREHGCHDGAPASWVVVLRHKNFPVVDEQILALERVEGVPVKRGRVGHDFCGIGLANPVRAAAVVVEEGPEAGAIDEDVVAG